MGFKDSRTSLAAQKGKTPPPDDTRGGEPSKLRLSTPYYLRKQDIDKYLAAFDRYKKTMA